MSLIYVIEDEPILADIIALAASTANQLPLPSAPTSPTSHLNSASASAPSLNPLSPADRALSALNSQLAAQDFSASQPSSQLEPYDVAIFYEGVTAMSAVETRLPDLILLDILLTGPDGFAFLNELASYSDTAKIPVIIISSLDFSGQDLSHYGVIRILDKNTMTPDDIKSAVRTGLEFRAQQLAQSQPPVSFQNPSAPTLNPAQTSVQPSASLQNSAIPPQPQSPSSTPPANL